MGISLEASQVISDEKSSEAVLTSNKKQRTGKANRIANSSRGQHRNGGRLGTDAIGFYLSTIGRVPLLTPAEEIELAHHVQKIKALMEIPIEKQS